jgi:hypothetical protein
LGRHWDHVFSASAEKLLRLQASLWDLGTVIFTEVSSLGASQMGKFMPPIILFLQEHRFSWPSKSGAQNFNQGIIFLAVSSPNVAKICHTLLPVQIFSLRSESFTLDGSCSLLGPGLPVPST